MLGQGGRGGGGPAARAAEVNAGPAWFPAHPQGVSRASVYFEDSAELLFFVERKTLGQVILRRGKNQDFHSRRSRS